ncbi:amidohydrolase [Rhizorhabdus wittichii]|uniref:Amidohydrolase n=1 Tax=Rhizorhabdus wittichii TaxID=160791 RepID=A0A975D5J7_9SPHN|nr:amidohydrolase [Rhizorhabdus wittichii]QTH23089.1 amidohydrolase [Rhizorhabdus wittichii]
MKTARHKATLIIAALLSASALQAADRTADLILTNGEVYTPQGWAAGVAVKDGAILAVGDAAALGAYRAPSTKMVDLGGKTVMPGLYDMHVHPLGAGLAMSECRFEYGAAPQHILDAVTACVKAAKPGEWITGGRWQAVSFGDTPPTREMLDRVAPNNPVALTDISGHSMWTNSLALKLAGITRDTPDPEGGIIERDARGEATGLLRESGRDQVKRAIPAPSLEKNVKALDTALDTMLSHGVTGLVDARVPRAGLETYAALADRGLLKQRVVGCLHYSGDKEFEDILRNRRSYERARFRTDCVKMYEDGVPTESHTAAMIDPYAPGADGHLHEPARGLLLVGPATLDPLVTRLDKMGITVKFHAAGDQASRTALDAIAAARKANGPNGPMHEVGHLTFVKPDDLARAKTIRATLEFSPYLWFPSAINDDIIKAIGPDRIKRVWPVREGLDSGALVIAGSDWSVVPSANPWIGIETLVTRRAPDDQRPGEVYGPAEAITLKEAIDIFTINAARQLGMADKLGTIEPGKIADLIILDRNPFKIPATDVHNVVVTQVIIDGKTAYQHP